MRTYGKIGAVVVLAGLLVSVLPRAVFAQTPAFYDSEIVPVTTQSTAPANPNDYSLTCSGLDSQTIYVGWTANEQNPPSGSLYLTETGGNFKAVSPVVNVNGSGATIIALGANGTVQGFAPPLYFKVVSAAGDLSKMVGGCSPLGAVSGDAPSQLNIFTNGPATLYLNWKDNSTSTATSTFEIQRFQVTPGTPSNLSATQQGNSLKVSWNNNPVNSEPFYGILERSTSADFTANLVTSTVSQSATSFSDPNVQIGPSYYYRLKDVSQIPVNEFYTNNINSTVQKPDTASSTYAVVGPVELRQFPSPTVFIEQSLGKIIGWLFGAPTAEGQTNSSINYNSYFTSIASGITNPSYLDSSLSSSTIYMYRVRLTKGSSSTWSNMVAGITLPSSSLGGSAVSICTAYGYCNHNVAGYSYLYSSPPQYSESQCTVNADCRNVGRASTHTQEQ